MPIRPENRDRYPENWDEISKEIRFGRAKGRCECEGECGTGHMGRCPRRHGQQLSPQAKVVLTTAHLNHTPEDCDRDNLKGMCQRCHLGYDRKHHAETAARTRDERRRTGMTPLFP